MVVRLAGNAGVVLQEKKKKRRPGNAAQHCALISVMKCSGEHAVITPADVIVQKVRTGNEMMYGLLLSSRGVCVCAVCVCLNV